MPTKFSLLVYLFFIMCYHMFMTKRSRNAIAVGAVLIGIAALTAWFVHSYTSSNEASDSDETADNS